MRWEERLLQELDDLELQAEGLHLAERDATVAELSVASYTEIDLMSRLHASEGEQVSLVLRGGAGADGVLARAGRDWVLLAQGRSEVLVSAAAIVRVRGASERAVPAVARPLFARLGIGSALRHVAEESGEVGLTMVDGSTIRDGSDGSVRTSWRSLPRPGRPS